MEIYILDTNLFFNMEGKMGFGNKTEEVIRNVNTALQELKANKQVMVYMPPRIVDELLSFFEDKEQPFLKDFLGSITIQSPDIHSMTIPASVFAEYVEENRSRAYRGMTVAEEEIQKAGTMFMGKEMLGKKEFQMTIGALIRGFRERFRTATRVGYIDSLGDLDLILLAKELNATIVSTDEGVLRWSRIIGVKEIPASVWGEKMRNLLK